MVVANVQMIEGVTRSSHSFSHNSPIRSGTDHWMDDMKMIFLLKTNPRHVLHFQSESRLDFFSDWNKEMMKEKKKKNCEWDWKAGPLEVLVSRGNVQWRLSQGWRMLFFYYKILYPNRFQPNTLLYFADRKSEPLLRPDAKDHSKVKDQMSAQPPQTGQPKLGSNILLQDTFLHHNSSHGRTCSLTIWTTMMILLWITQNT